MKCKTKFCRNTPKQGLVCGTCRSREYRKNNPVRASFMSHRTNAKRRGKHWDLTFMQFLFFVNQTDFLSRPGRTPASFTLERINNELAYTFPNIDRVTYSYNSGKSDRQYYHLRDRYGIAE